MFCGCPPFQEDQSSEIFTKIKTGSYDFHEDQWSRVSPSAVDFVSRMLTVNQTKRYSVDKLLGHPWILSSFGTGAEVSLDICVSHLRRYTARRKLKALAQVVVMTNRMKKYASSRSGSIRSHQEKILTSTGEENAGRE